MNTADTFAVRQSEGRTAVSNDRWKMSPSAGARVSAQFFKMTFGIWSGPHALWGLMVLSNFGCVNVNITYNWVLWRVKVWGSRSTISGEDTLELVQEDFSLLLAVTHQ